MARTSSLFSTTPGYGRSLSARIRKAYTAGRVRIPLSSSDAGNLNLGCFFPLLGPAFTSWALVSTTSSFNITTAVRFSRAGQHHRSHLTGSSSLQYDIRLYDTASVLLLLAATFQSGATVEETRGSTPLSPFSIGPEYYQARWVPRNAFLEVKRIANGSVNKAVI